MAEVASWVIESEDSLWELLDQATTQPDLAVGVSVLRVRDWQPQLLYFPDQTIGHSIRPATAKAVADYHASLSRAYALVVYGEANRQLLRKEDKEALDLIFLATDGSNGLSVFSEGLDRFFEKMAAKLTGRQVVAIILIFGALYFTGDTAKEFYAASLEEKLERERIWERLELSAQETERTRLLTEAMEQFGITMQLRNEADEAKRALVRPSTQEGRSRVLGVDLTRGQAQTILSSERVERVGQRLDGIYEVVDINTESEDGYAVRIRNVETGDEFNAAANFGEMTQEDIHVIFEVAEAKNVFRASVNAFYIGDKIRDAFIVRADKVTSSSSGDE